MKRMESHRRDAAGAPRTEDELERLLASMAKGQEAALERFYDLTAKRAYAFVLRILRDPMQAEDVVEEAFFQMWCKAGDFDVSRGNALAWLFTICRSRALDRLRQRDDAEYYDDASELENRLAEDDWEAAEARDPFALIHAMERSSAVHAALGSLSPQSRQVVSLAFFRGMSHSEIAAAFNMPLGTVKTTINRACEKMRGHIIHAGVAS